MSRSTFKLPLQRPCQAPDQKQRWGYCCQWPCQAPDQKQRCGCCKLLLSAALLTPRPKAEVAVQPLARVGLLPPMTLSRARPPTELEVPLLLPEASQCLWGAGLLLAPSRKVRSTVSLIKKEHVSGRYQSLLSSSCCTCTHYAAALQTHLCRWYCTMQNVAAQQSDGQSSPLRTAITSVCRHARC